MKQLKYDIVVIGSGVGGLTAAALLSKAGYKTLVVEKLSFTGGRCSTVDYHGYKLPTGAIMFTEECQGALCKEVGAEFELRVPQTMYVYRIEGKDYPAPPTGALKTLIGHVKRDDAEAERVWQAFKRSLTWAEPSYSMSFEDWIKQSTDNPGILGIFRYLCAMLSGTTPSEVPAGEYFRMFKGVVPSPMR
jgi:phytoene desaturase